MKIDLNPPLADCKTEMLAKVDAEASEQRAALMPLDDLLMLIADVLEDPADSPARQKLADWRARAAEIQNARQRAREAVSSARTVADALSRAKPD